MKAITTLLLALVLCPATQFAQCNGGHSTDWSDAWVSCSGQENPNPERLEEHWIQYDFGQYYEINESHIWNFNVQGETDKGVKDIHVDVSNDAISWTSVGDFTVTEAPGADDYLGEVGPDFEGSVARYVLLSVVSNWGDNECQGFAEIKFIVEPTAVSIPVLEQPLDFIVYPNPANEMLTVELDRGQPTTVDLIDATGQVVYSSQETSHRFRIPVSEISTGVYFLRVTDGDNLSGITRVVIFH